SCPGPCGGGGSPTRAYTDSLYDANMNLVRVKYKALDCDGSPQGNNAISTFYEYDILNEMTEIREEVASGQVLKNVIVLDANREPIVELQGEAATGADPFNIKTTVYDERGLVFREIRGDGSPDASTTQHDYDLNGNEVI